MWTIFQEYSLADMVRLMKELRALLRSAPEVRNAIRISRLCLGINATTLDMGKGSCRYKRRKSLLSGLNRSSRFL